MIFTRRFGALAARRDFNDRPRVVEADLTTTLSDRASQPELDRVSDEVAA